MNAFRDAAGFLGNAADAVLLGGAVGKTRRRNAFADMIEGGDYQGASAFATRHGRDDLAQYASQQGAGQAQAAQKRQQDQASILGRIAEYGDSLPNEARLGYAQSIAPILQSQFDLDDDDVNAIMQAAQVPQGFGALAAAFIDPNQQQQNQFEDRKITETGRANVAGERLRGGELGVSQGNLALGRDKLTEDARQFDAGQVMTSSGAAAPKLTEGERKFATFARLAANAQQTISELENDPKFNATLVQRGPFNLTRNPKGQSYEAAKRAFIDAIIRPMTGAAVTEFEFNSAEKRYFPQLGDDPQTVQFKQKLRQEAIDAIADGSGRASGLAQAGQTQNGAFDPSQMSDEELDAQIRALGGQ